MDFFRIENKNFEQYIFFYLGKKKGICRDFNYLDVKSCGVPIRPSRINTRHFIIQIYNMSRNIYYSTWEKNFPFLRSGISSKNFKNI